MQNIYDALFHISPAARPNTSGLGTLCGHNIITCAHIHDQLPVKLDEDSLFDVRRVHDGKEATFAMLFGSTLDVLVLSPDSMFVGLAEGDGPTASALDMYYEYIDCHTPIKPALISFKPGSKTAIVDGFFFAPDVKTVHKAQFYLEDGSPYIRFSSHDVQCGCSGGPLFTKELKLIGVLTNLDNAGQIGAKECFGRRIDSCLPVCVYPQMDFETVVL